MLHKIMFILKNGERFTMRCETFKTTTQDGSLTDITYGGATWPRPVFVDLDQIVAIIDEGIIPEEVKENENNEDEQDH